MVLSAGWRHAAVLDERNAASDEISLTQCLRKGMITELSTRRDAWCKEMTILPGTETQSASSLLKPDGLTDISIHLQDIRERHGEHDPHAIIECKRVSKDDATLCRRYVACGIDRFASGKYAIRHATGFMVGYVISGCVRAAVDKINLRLTRIKRYAERLEESGMTGTAWTCFSRHPRPKAHVAIELHHAFFVFGP